MTQEELEEGTRLSHDIAILDKIINGELVDISIVEVDREYMGTIEEAYRVDFSTQFLKEFLNWLQKKDKEYKEKLEAL